MKNQEAIEFLKNMIDREAIGFVCPEREGDVAIWQYHVEALQMAISTLQAQDVPDTSVGDMISKRAAIDALDSIGSLDTDADREYAREVFETLPSAQPDRCDTCRFVYYPKETNNNDE